MLALTKNNVKENSIYSTVRHRHKCLPRQHLSQSAPKPESNCFSGDKQQSGPLFSG